MEANKNLNKFDYTVAALFGLISIVLNWIELTNHINLYEPAPWLFVLAKNILMFPVATEGILFQGASGGSGLGFALFLSYPVVSFGAWFLAFLILAKIIRLFGRNRIARACYLVYICFFLFMSIVFVYFLYFDREVQIDKSLAMMSGTAVPRDYIAYCKNLSHDKKVSNTGLTENKYCLFNILNSEEIFTDGQIYKLIPAQPANPQGVVFSMDSYFGNYDDIQFKAWLQGIVCANMSYIESTITSDECFSYLIDHPQRFTNNGITQTVAEQQTKINEYCAFSSPSGKPVGCDKLQK